MAGDAVRAVNILAGRRLFADIHAFRAAGRELAALGQIGRVGKQTVDRAEACALDQKIGNGTKQTVGVRMMLIGLEDILSRPFFHQLTGIHDGDFIAHLGDDAQIVGSVPISPSKFLMVTV